jgi:hypothetical protein
MHRSVAPVVFLSALVLALTGVAARPSTSAIDLALGATPMSTPTPTPPTELCADPAEEAYFPYILARPDAGPAAKTVPTDAPAGQSFYLVELTIPRGICVPYDADGNKKEGAVIMMVAQGAIELTVEPYGAPPMAEVLWGHSWSEDGSALPEGTPQILYPGDWVTMKDQVWFTYESVGDEDAVIIKTVWAVSPPDIGSHGGKK